MRLAEDDRARIPFALLGVLLLVGSSTFAASLATPGPAPVDRSADVVADRVDAEATAALRTAARDAATAAARDPVTVTADSDAGTALAGSDIFRRYLRLRIFLAARAAMDPIEHRRGESVARASFGDSVADASEAIERVSIAGLDDGTELQVTIRGLELTVESESRTLETRRVNRTVTVGIPVLALHDRTMNFQERLNAGPLESPGLARRTTVGVTAMAQARGLGQYGGLPIENVVGNRHVALSTNAGLLDAQRAAFGRADPDAAAGVRAATLRTGLTDLLGARADPRVVSAVTGRLPDPNAAERSETRTDWRSLPATRTISVGVNGTADEAFLSLLRGSNGAQRLESIRHDGYRATVSVRAGVRTIDDERRPTPRPPGENWTLAHSDTSKALSVTEYRSRRRGNPRVGVGTRRLYSATRRVIERWRVERTWVKVNETPRTTSASWRDVHRVHIIGTGRLRETAAPTRPLGSVFESGGALSGPNLREGRSEADRLVSALGGPDAIARKAATGGRTSGSRAIVGERPADLDAWVYADLAQLRDRVRTLSVDVAASDAATGRANGAARLAALVRDQRAELLDTPTRYDGVADRTRVAARAAYLDRVVARLDDRAGQTRSQNDGIDRALDASGLGPSRVAELAALTPHAPSPRTNVGEKTGVRGETVLVPDADPAYLALDPVEGTLVDGIADDERYVGLAVRNVNVFSVPYGDSADLVTRTLLGDPGRVSLHTAGQALLAADSTLETHRNPQLRARRDALARAVERSMRDVRTTATRTLARETSLSRDERRRVVDQSFDRFDGPGERSVAATDGSLARAVAAVAIKPNSTGRRASALAADRLSTALRVELRRVATSERVRVPESAVDDAVTSTRTFAEKAVTDAAGRATERGVARATNDTIGGIPAGVPLSPTLSPWVATANLWVVESRGAYGRFAVSVEESETAYVRDGAVVALDVDGDGETEALGRSERIGFRVRTVAVAVVPPGRLGVGDTDGNADERSMAWSGSAPGPRCVTTTGQCYRE
ncbi:MAG: hypothetical protein ABEI27_11400 [Halobellus sp.]|uniref:DUF7286 family protein n=1 Tax=Halobellus sp. TaxID=1979212 RepID=UPI0035D4EA1C